ncbi:hypothetical protein [Halobacterium sp. R2-5]|uniref:hypothetical protein n=1 Tax=Halobacterium sp. R2-5 TaxID=2715751 RepID=UPI001423ED29|nr:hypothetical protein [Halobacterium sp. R2-5]NIC00053.1 hypothetical protein [Halobacterium sp. R2-5]
MNGNERDDTGTAERRITRDRDTIRSWADDHNAALVTREDPDSDEHRYEFVRDANASADTSESTWSEFFDWFEGGDRVFIYSEGESDPGHYEILDRDEATARASIADEEVEQQLLDGETVVTEVTDRTVVQREVVEHDQLETEVVDREVVSSRITEADLLDWEVLETGSDFDLRPAQDIVGRDVMMAGGSEYFDYTDIELGTRLDGYLTAEIEEMWRVRRVVDEQATVETRVVDVDVETHDTVEAETTTADSGTTGSDTTRMDATGPDTAESETAESRIDTTDVHQTVFASDAVGADVDTSGDTADLVETERLDEGQFESVLVERQVFEDEVRRRKQFRFENVDSDVVETETIDTQRVDTDVIERDGEEPTAAETAGTPDVAGGPAETTETSGSLGRSFTESDEGETVVSADGDKIGEIDHVEAGAAFVEPKSGLVDSISSALGWGDDQGEYGLRPEQVQGVDERGRFVVSPGAESQIEDDDSDERA